MRKRLVAALVALGVGIAYAISPIDVIPDFIPFFGLLDDVLVVAVSTLTAMGLGGSALWLEKRGRALAEPKPAYEPVAADEIRTL